MERRRLLGSLAVLVGLGGCFIRSGSAAPVHFELWNRTDSAHEVSVAIEQPEAETVLERTYRIDAHSDGVPGGPMVRETAITEATNDTLLEAHVELNDRSSWTHLYRVTCSDDDTENRIVAEVVAGREPSVRFDGSHCG